MNFDPGYTLKTTSLPKKIECSKKMPIYSKLSFCWFKNIVLYFYTTGGNQNLTISFKDINICII